jgi:hypothetical protein
MIREQKAFGLYLAYRERGELYSEFWEKKGRAVATLPEPAVRMGSEVGWLVIRLFTPKNSQGQSHGCRFLRGSNSIILLQARPDDNRMRPEFTDLLLAGKGGHFNAT